MQIGKKIGPFTIEEELGSGAMGTVYRVTYRDDKGREKTLALKIISAGLSGSETALARFDREAQILKQLKHPNIVSLFAPGRYKGTPFFSMEFVEGESLDAVLARRLRLSWEEIVLIGKQICSALQHAHEKGIIHRDLKPSNLMRLEDGTVKLTDFGIAKDMDVTALTGANATVGTAAYMSPEQCRGENITAKSDLYSLGCVFFELLTGRKPFIAESPVDMFMKHVNEAPPRPNWILKGSSAGEIPTWLETIVLQLMEKKPEHRPLNAQMVADSLEEGLQKHYRGQSAAVDAVQAKAGDRRIQSNVIDETDREAARSLRSVLQKKKIRKKTSPLYTRTWFQLIAIPAFLLSFVLVIVFVIAPMTKSSANELYRVAEKKMASPETYQEALYAKLSRNREGPILEFLRRFPDDPRAGQVAEWKDLAETTDVLDKLRHNMSKPRVLHKYWDKVDPNYEELAFQALRYEDYGDLFYAGERWNQARTLASKDPEQRVATRLAEIRHARLHSQWNTEREKDPKTYDDARLYRTMLLEKKLEEARRLKADSRMKDLQILAEQTAELYKDEKDKNAQKLVESIGEVWKPKKPAEDKKQP
jgi:eukaryotic-like serine/threonine-protein kinase